MPFANKFRAMMDFPFAGDTVGDFVVESVDVRDEGSGRMGYAYSVRIVLCGRGGKQGVRRALKDLFASHTTTFSAYGNPYQLWFGRPEIESLGDQRYSVTAEGGGARVYLEDELRQFLAYLDESGQLAARSDQADAEPLVENYLDSYQADIRRRVDRYRRKLRKREGQKT